MTLQHQDTYGRVWAALAWQEGHRARMPPSVRKDDPRSVQARDPYTAERRRRALAMFDGGMSYRDVADAIGVSETTIKNDVYLQRRQSPA